jgi:hypothetical protein
VIEVFSVRGTVTTREPKVSAKVVSTGS